MPETEERKLETLDQRLNTASLMLESVKVSQNFLTSQYTAILSKLDQLSDSLGNPSSSSLGRELVSQINGLATRIDASLVAVDERIEYNKKLATEVHEQNLKLQGALGLMKFVGFSALISGVIALVMMFLQIANIGK